MTVECYAHLTVMTLADLRVAASGFIKCLFRLTCQLNWTWGLELVVQIDLLIIFCLQKLIQP